MQTEQQKQSQENVSSLTLPPVKTIENPEHRLIETIFLPAQLSDNPILTERDPGYKERLYAQGERLANALLKGDWSIFAGQFLSEFSFHRHTCDPFEIPRSWTRFRGYDWGFAAPAYMCWIAKEPSTGRLFMYRELYQSKLTDPEQAEMINDMTEPWEKFNFNWADPAVWAKRTQSENITSTYDVFLKHQIYLTRGDNNQVRKAGKLRAALADIHDGDPGIKIFRTCVNTIAELEGLTTDPNRPEKPMRGQADHAYDGLCYALSNYSAPAIMTKLDDGFKRVIENPFANMNGV